MKAKTKERNRHVSFRVSEEEHEYLEQKRELTGMNLRRFIMSCVENEPIRVIPGAHVVAGQIARVGNNLNQLTRHINSGRVPDSCEQILREIREDISEIRRAWQ